MDEVAKAVEECARAAKQAAPSLAAASAEAVDAALSGMADRLLEHREAVLEANRADVERSRADGMSAGLLDRLTITPERLTGMAEQLRLLAGAPHQERSIDVSTLDGGLCRGVTRPGLSASFTAAESSSATYVCVATERSG